MIYFSEVTLLIVAGGKSSRMGQDKRLVKVGGLTLLESILIKAHKENFSKILLCVESSATNNYPSAGDVELVFDKVRGAGPMGGLAEGLKHMKTEWALAVSCDMPFFEFEAVVPLLGELDGVKVAMYEHQPLAAFYHKSMAEVFSRALSVGQHKLQLAINEVPYVVRPFPSLPTREIFSCSPPTHPRGEKISQGRLESLDLSARPPALQKTFAGAQPAPPELQKTLGAQPAPPELRKPLGAQRAVFFNVNRPEELRLAQGRAANLSRQTPIVSVIAPKSGTGKTTFITRVIPKLIERGLRVGCVKHTHHKLSEDETGKDSGRMKVAGAVFVKFDAKEIFSCLPPSHPDCEKISSPARQQDYGLGPPRPPSLENISSPTVDVILVESRTFEVLPTISLYRGLEEPVVSENVVALFTDSPLEVEGIAQYDLNDIERAAEVIVFLCGR